MQLKELPFVTWSICLRGEPSSLQYLSGFCFQINQGKLVLNTAGFKLPGRSDKVSLGLIQTGQRLGSGPVRFFDVIPDSPGKFQRPLLPLIR